MFKHAPTSIVLPQVGPTEKATYSPSIIERLPNKPIKRLPKIMLFACFMVALLVFTTSCGKPDPKTGQYTYSFSVGPISLSITPILPPKALSELVSDYLRVNVDVGSFHFSTDDPAFTCFESLAPLIFTSKEVSFADVFIVAYNDCRSGTTGHPGQIEAAIAAPGSAHDDGSMVAFWTFPRSQLRGCTTFVATGATSCTLENPTPTPIPTVAPTTGPSGNPIDSTAANIITNAQMASSIDNGCNPINQTSSFQVGQTIYVTFDLNLPSDGYFIAKWYEDNNPPATSPPGFFNMGAPRGCAHYSYANAGNGAVELYWCTQSNCSDAALAAYVNFTVS